MNQPPANTKCVIISTHMSIAWPACGPARQHSSKSATKKFLPLHWFSICMNVPIGIQMPFHAWITTKTRTFQQKMKVQWGTSSFPLNITFMEKLYCESFGTQETQKSNRTTYFLIKTWGAAVQLSWQSRQSHAQYEDGGPATSIWNSKCTSSTRIHSSTSAGICSSTWAGICSSTSAGICSTTPLCSFTSAGRSATSATGDKFFTYAVFFLQDPKGTNVKYTCVFRLWWSSMCRAP